MNQMPRDRFVKGRRPLGSTSSTTANDESTAGIGHDASDITSDLEATHEDIISLDESSSISDTSSANISGRSVNNSRGRSVNSSFATPVNAAGNSWVTPFLLIALIVASLALVWNHILSSAPGSTSSSNTPSACNFSFLATRFPRQSPRLWRHLQIGVDAVRQERGPVQACYLLVRGCSGGASDGDADADDVVSHIAATAHRCLRPDGDQPPFLRLGPAEFNAHDAVDGGARDYGRLVADVRPRLAAARVLLVEDVQAVHGLAARALHFLCDGVQPPVERSVVVLTMRSTAVRCAEAAKAEVLEEKVSEEEPLLTRVERQLVGAWSELHGDVLGPLVTRVTDQVLQLE